MPTKKNLYIYKNGQYVVMKLPNDNVENGTGENSLAQVGDNNAGYANQAVVGKFNDNKSTTLFEVGNGTANDARSNAFEVGADGTAKVGAMGNDNLSVATKGYVDTGSANLAPLFDDTATYDTDDLVVYQNVLYVCTTPHSGAWNASHFTQGDVATLILGLINTEM